LHEEKFQQYISMIEAKYPLLKGFESWYDWSH
jgi:hypothetical protein